MSRRLSQRGPTKSFTGQSAQQRRAPGAPRRSTRTLDSDLSMERRTSPSIVRQEFIDGEEVFNSNSGGKGGLDYNGIKEASTSPGDSDMENDVQESSPSPVIQTKRKLVEAKRTSGRHRTSPQPRAIKNRVQVVTKSPQGCRTQTSSRNSARTKLSGADEGYDSAESEDNGHKENANMNVCAGDSDNDDEAVEESGSQGSSDCVTREGSQCGSVFDSNEQEHGDDEADKETLDDSMEIDPPTSSPMPTRITSPIMQRSKKRSQDMLSDSDASVRPSKRQTTDSASGMRIMRASTYKPFHSMGPGNSKGGNSAKASLPHLNRKDKSGRTLTKNNIVTLRDRGCEVTDDSKQTGPLLGTYFGLKPLKSSKIACSNDLAGANLGILFTGNRFAQGHDLKRVRSIVTIPRIMTAFITNPARDDPDDFVFKPIGQQSIFAFKVGGEVADVIVFGFVMRSSVVEGRTYNASNSMRQLKDIEVIPIAQEGERLLAMLSMVTGGKILSLAVTDDGAVTFSTKHTVVDEDGNPESKKHKLGRDFLHAPGRAEVQGDQVHLDIQRRPRDGTDTIPVFNADGHLSDDAPFQAEDILTQRARVDPSWNREIPVGSFVAVHSTVTIYTNQKAKIKSLSFNLAAVQILALPDEIDD